MVAPSSGEGIEDVVERHHSALPPSLKADVEHDGKSLLGDKNAFSMLFRRKVSFAGELGEKTTQLDIEDRAEEIPDAIGGRWGWPSPPLVVVGCARRSIVIRKIGAS